MLEFSVVSREFRSLIGRRRELQTLLGSVFAGLGIFLQNALQGGLPDSLGSIRRHVFAFYAVMLMVPCLILALRMARLHGGLVLNGILFARLMQEQNFTPKPSLARAARHNYSAVSFVQFVLMDLMSGFSTTILVLAIEGSMVIALGAGGLVMAVWMAWYFRFHAEAARFALAKSRDMECAPFRREEWEEHLSGTLEDANSGLNAEVAFVGLVVFSVFETISGIGLARADGVDLAPEVFRTYGPTAYVSLMLITCLMGLVANLRIRVAIGKASLQLDPTDRPFRPLQLTDSLLGYLIVAFLFTVALHQLLGLLIPAFEHRQGLLLTIDAGSLVLAVAAEQVTLIVAGRAYRHLATGWEA